MRQVAISHDKLRENIGLVGIDADAKTRTVTAKLVRQWKIENVDGMAAETADLYERFSWNATLIDQTTGEYLISILKRHNLPIKVIRTGKKVKDPKELQKIKTMDIIEMTEFLRSLKLNGQLKFAKNPSKNMKILEEQIPYWTKHITEAGSVDYYAPGQEPDNMVRALMIACFSVRNLLDGNGGVSICGPIDDNWRNPHDRDPDEEFADAFPASKEG